MKKLATAWAIMPKKAKIIAVVVVVTAAYLIYRTYFKKKTDAELAAEQLENSISNTPVNKSNLTLTDNELNIMAAQLYKAMKGLFTDTATIDSVFSKVQTKDDLNALIRAYGIKDGEDLRMWLKGDLSGKRLTAVQKIFEDFGLVF